jgi:hypothetical protein
LFSAPRWCNENAQCLTDSLRCRGAEYPLGANVPGSDHAVEVGVDNGYQRLSWQ